MSENAEPDDVTSWLRARAVRLNSLDPGGGQDDLAPLAACWTGLDVVGLGESTHGTREFFTLKHRLIEFLVLELGLQVVAMEASESAATAVDEYVATGTGNAATVLAGLQFWTWDTREVLAVVEWLRRHNEQVPAERRVRFVGVDPQRPATAARTVASFLRRHGGADAARFLEPVEELGRRLPADPPAPADLVDRMRELRTLLDGAFPGAPGDEQHAARRHAGFLERSAQVFSAPRTGTYQDSVYAVRDRLMADAVVEAVEGAAGRPGLPVAVWAHNSHLSRGTADAVIGTMGSHLRERFGTGYYALGLTVGSGRFHARRKRLLRGTTAGPVAHRIAAPPPTTVEAKLAAAGDADFVVDLRAPDRPEPVDTWLTGRSWTRAHGAVVTAMHRVAFAPMTPGVEFDGLAFVHRGSPPTPC